MQIPPRYSKQVLLPDFGERAQLKLLEAKVLVVGAGGLGVPVLQYLAGMGVGIIGLVDGDKISVSNLNRQVIYSEDDAGKLKVTVAADKLRIQNPQVQIKTYPYFLTVSNAIDIIKAYDVIIDASDNFEARYLINDACVITGKPFIYGAIHRHEGHVSVFNFNGGPTYRCLFPTFPAAEEIPDCNTTGVLGIVPGIVGCYQALECIKIITGLGEVLSGKLLVMDLLNNSQYSLKLKVNPANHHIAFLQEQYSANCALEGVISPATLQKWYDSETEFYLLDVRELKEYQVAHLYNANLVPLTQLLSQPVDLPADIPVVTLCQRGSRSVKAASVLKQQDTSRKVFYLQGGMEQWMKDIGEKFVIT